MSTFYRKPIKVNFIKFNGNNADEIKNLIGSDACFSSLHDLNVYDESTGERFPVELNSIVVKEDKPFGKFEVMQQDKFDELFYSKD
jgi:hypothetical protein